jgi:hypothetical protein
LGFTTNHSSSMLL